VFSLRQKLWLSRNLLLPSDVRMEPIRLPAVSTVDSGGQLILCIAAINDRADRWKRRLHLDVGRQGEQNVFRRLDRRSHCLNLASIQPNIDCDPCSDYFLVCWVAREMKLVVLVFRQSRESVSTPLFTADTMVYKEQTLRIIFALDAAQPGIIHSPIILLPGAIEVIAFGNI
jgi:hypothetical protein